LCNGNPKKRQNASQAWRNGRRAAQSIEKAKSVYRCRKKDAERNALIRRHLKAGQSILKEIMELIGWRRGMVAKQAELLKAEQQAA
jgi:hypothetical protein